MRLVVRTIAALAIGSAALHAQARVTVADLGPGASGRIIQEALAKPHRLIEPDSVWFVLGRRLTPESHAARVAMPAERPVRVLHRGDGRLPGSAPA